MVRSPCKRGGGPGKHAIDTEALNYDFLGPYGGIVAKNVVPIEIGDSCTEVASLQLGGEEIGAVQKIGTVQGKAETNPEQTGGDQRHPGRKISVMSMDVLHVKRSQLLRQRGAHQSVTERAQAETRRCARIEQQR